MAITPVKSTIMDGIWYCPYCDKIHFSKERAYTCCRTKEGENDN